MELVSIVVPIYNKEKYLKKCIDSLLNQSYKNIEIILVNDGSTDRCEELCKSYLDKKIKYYYKENGGVSSARNYGIKKAAGEYLLFVDADDYVSYDYVEKLYNNRFDFVMCSFKTQVGEKIYNEYSLDKEVNNINDLNNLLFSNEFKRLLPIPYLKLFKKNIIDNNNILFDEGLSYGEDTCFVVEYLMYCDNAKIIDYSGYYNVIGEDESLSRKYVKNIFEQLSVLNKKIDDNKFLKKSRKSIWYFRNYKTILYNEVKMGWDTFNKYIKLIRDDAYYGCIDLSDFKKIDKILYYLIKFRFYILVYFIYKVKK